MPQNNVLPDWRATYPNDAPVQKPPGVTVLTTATAPRVPNKPTYSAGTIQMVDVGTLVATKVADAVVEHIREEHQPEAEPEPEPDDEPHGRSPRHRRR